VDIDLLRYVFLPVRLAICQFYPQAAGLLPRRRSVPSRIGVAAVGLLLIAASACGGGGTAPTTASSNNPVPPVQQQPVTHTAVPTYHNSNSRAGLNSTETILTPSNVGSATFGKLGAVTVEGDIFAQPLYVPQVKTASGTHNLVIVATEHDQVYGIDADSRQIVWHTDFLGSSGTVTTVDANDVTCPAIAPEIGITGTPVIDTTSSTVYLLARTKETPSGQPVFYQRLHALDLATGQDKLTPTVVATPADPGGQFGVAQFSSLLNNQRSALLLANGQVYVAWASHCDLNTYQGWLMAFDAGTLQLSQGWTSEPSGQEGGIWMAGGGPAADDSGDVYLAVGNGWSDVMSGGQNYGDSVVRFQTSGGQLSVADYFIPFDWLTLDDEDRDLGSGGPILLPDQTGGAHTHLLVVAGKAAKVYMLDRDNLGQSQPSGDNQIVQSFQSDGRLSLNTPAFWNNHLYFGWLSGPVESFAYNPATQQISSTPSSTTLPFDVGYPGATVSISANGNLDGIVWVLRNDGAYADLRAYSATNLHFELYSSEDSPSRDQSGPSVTFGIPTVADGYVFVGTRGELDIYGLLSR
jgi:hypothetical protein